VLGAIVIVGPERCGAEPGLSGSEPTARATNSSASPGQGTPLACVDILGRSVLDRAVDDLRQVGVDPITILADISLAPIRSDVDQSTRLPISWLDDAWSGAAQILTAYKEGGIIATFVIGVSAYAELDLLDALEFHRQQHHVVTRAFDQQSALSVWVIDMAGITGDDIVAVLQMPRQGRYLVSGYVNRLGQLRDLRRLVVDSLNLRCRVRPQGSEIRPGVWMDEGAQVHRRARIVAPAFIGRGSKIEQQCLITRGSNVESNCHIDYGTVVEDSSILSNTYVGIGLDITHSIVNRSQLLNLERDVLLEIGDPGLIRQNRIPRKESSVQSQAAFGTEALVFAQTAKTLPE